MEDIYKDINSRIVIEYEAQLSESVYARKTVQLENWIAHLDYVSTKLESALCHSSITEILQFMRDISYTDMEGELWLLRYVANRLLKVRPDLIAVVQYKVGRPSKYHKALNLMHGGAQLRAISGLVRACNAERSPFSTFLAALYAFVCTGRASGDERNKRRGRTAHPTEELLQRTTYHGAGQTRRTSSDFYRTRTAYRIKADSSLRLLPFDRDLLLLANNHMYGDTYFGKIHTLNFRTQLASPWYAGPSDDDYSISISVITNDGREAAIENQRKRKAERRRIHENNRAHALSRPPGQLHEKEQEVWEEWQDEYERRHGR